MTACLRLLLCLTSASVDTSTAPEKHGTSLVAPGNKKPYQMVPNLPKQSIIMLKLDGISMAAPVEVPTTSSSDAERPTKISVPELYGTPHNISSGRFTGSPVESNTESKKPHDAIFMCRRALRTSLWRIWMATKLLLQIKANGI